MLLTNLGHNGYYSKNQKLQGTPYDFVFLENV